MPLKRCRPSWLEKSRFPTFQHKLHKSKVGPGGMQIWQDQRMSQMVARSHPSQSNPSCGERNTICRKKRTNVSIGDETGIGFLIRRAKDDLSRTKHHELRHRFLIDIPVLGFERGLREAQ